MWRLILGSGDLGSSGLAGSGGGWVQAVTERALVLSQSGELISTSKRGKNTPLWLPHGRASSLQGSALAHKHLPSTSCPIAHFLRSRCPAAHDY